MKTGVWWAVAMVLMVVLLGVPNSGAAGDDATRVLATVGQEKITQADIEAKIATLPPQFRSRYDNPAGRQELLDQTIKFALMGQEARRLQLDRLPEVARRIKEVTDSILVQELTRTEVAEKVTVAEEEIAAYYDTHADRFVKQEKIKAALMFFEAGDDDAAARARAQQARARVMAGEDFADVAKAVSEDKRTQRRGGNTGYFSRGRREGAYGKAFEDAAFALQTGAVSEVFKAKNGYYIVKVDARKERTQQTLEEVRGRIERQLKQDRQKELFDSYVEQLKQRYPVTLSE